MRKIISVIVIFFAFTSFLSLSAQWARTYGGSDDDHAYSIQQTSDGGYIVAGQTKSWGAGESDLWILKLTSNGDIEWQKIYGNDSYDYTQSIQQTDDGGYIIAGYTYSFGTSDDLWILKLTSNGDIEWQSIYGGSYSDKAYSIHQTNEGGYIVAGQTKSWGIGSGDIWILRLTSTGDIIWENSYGGSSGDLAYSIQQTSDEGYIVAGETSSFGTGDSDLWILKLTWHGDIEWQRTYGDSYSDKAYSIQQTSDRGYIVAGETSSFGAGDSDFLVLKLNSVGSIEWQSTYGGVYSDKAYSIQQTGDGGYIVAGRSSISLGKDDFYLVKLYAGGDIAPSCYLEEISNAYITDTSISPENTNITVMWTSMGTPVSFNCTMIDTAAIVDLICEAPKYTLTISTTDRGTTDPASGSYSYYDRTEVQIEAIPDEDYEFLYWSGDVPSGYENDNPITVTMNSDKSIKANFQYTLTIAAGIGGTTEPSQGTYTYDYGTEVTITAIPDSDYRFSEWTGDIPSDHENDNPITITLDESKSITANFIHQYNLIIAAETGGTTDPTPSTYIYDEGTEVVVTATPDSGYRFSGWSGDVLGTDNPIVITMDSDKSVAANFIRQYTLTIVSNSGGTTNPSPGSYAYDTGAQVSITAIPNSGYEFSGWSGNISGTSNPTTITMDSNKSVTASFSATGGGGSGAGSVDSGGGGLCFIATAAYGSTLHPHVKTLREFRDKYLMPNKVGRTLVNLYYKYSPSVANLIAKNKALKVIVRNQLVPFVAFSYAAVHFGPITTLIVFVLILAIPIFFMLFYRRRII